MRGRKIRPRAQRAAICTLGSPLLQSLETPLHACSVDSELPFSAALVGLNMPYRWYSSTQFMEGLWGVEQFLSCTLRICLYTCLLYRKWTGEVAVIMLLSYATGSWRQDQECFSQRQDQSAWDASHRDLGDRSGSITFRSWQLGYRGISSRRTSMITLTMLELASSCVQYVEVIKKKDKSLLIKRSW